MVVIDRASKFKEYLNTKDAFRGIPVMFKGLRFTEPGNLDNLWGLSLYADTIFSDCYFKDIEYEDTGSSSFALTVKGDAVHFINCKMDNFYPKFLVYRQNDFYSISLKGVTNNNAIEFGTNLNTASIASSNIGKVIFDGAVNSDILIMDSSLEEIEFKSFETLFNNNNFQIIGSNVQRILIGNSYFKEINRESKTIDSLLNVPKEKVFVSSIRFNESIMGGIDLSRLEVTQGITFSRCNMSGFVFPEEPIRGKLEGGISITISQCSGLDEMVLPRGINLFRLSNVPHIYSLIGV